MPTVAAVLDDVLSRLPPKPLAQCSRAKILAAIQSVGCAPDADADVLRRCVEDSLMHVRKRDMLRKALKDAGTPIVVLAKLSVAVKVPEAEPQPGEPLPGEPLLSEPLPEDAEVSDATRAVTRVASFPFAVMLHGDENRRQPRFIRGSQPRRPQVLRMGGLYSRERAIYPPSFLEAINMQLLVLCEELSYDEQQRRDVIDMRRGTFFVDASDLHARRSRHCFHHELWHMADFKLRGVQFEAADPQWEALNPAGFVYGDDRGNVGGKHLR